MEICSRADSVMFNYTRIRAGRVTLSSVKRPKTLKGAAKEEKWVHPRDVVLLSQDLGVHCTEISIIARVECMRGD